MKMRIFKNSLVLLMFGAFFASCDLTKDPDELGTSAKGIAGEWYVQTFVEGVPTLDYVPLKTFNTAANIAEMWFDDGDNSLGLRGVVKTDAPNLSFGSLIENNEYYEEQVPDAGYDPEAGLVVGDIFSFETDPEFPGYPEFFEIKKGIVVKNGATTSGGNKSDSIYVELAVPNLVYNWRVAGFDTEVNGETIDTLGVQWEFVDRVNLGNIKVEYIGYKRTGFAEDDH